MSTVSPLLPGVPAVESPFFRGLFEHVDPVTRAAAESLARDGFAVIDFPEPEFDRVSESIRRSLHDRFQWDTWRNQGFAQGAGMRLQDAWLHDENVRRIAINEEVIALLSRLYGRAAFPFQTLNFPVGSQQHYHSDAVLFSSMPERFMCGVWVALEDVSDDAGPLVVYPGSHKWPIYVNEHIGLCMAESGLPASQTPYEALWRAQVSEAGIEPQRFGARKGQAIIWASNLLHGGARQLNPNATRWSQVTHYYFEDCAFYSPMRSDIPYGRIAFLEPRDIRSGVAVPGRYVGHAIDPDFVRLTQPRPAVGLPQGFDAEQYFLANPDVRASGMSAADHWLLHGRSEKRPLVPAKL